MTEGAHQQPITEQQPTFLHRLERVVGLDEFDGVCDLLALQDVIAETEVRHGELEHLIIPHGVLLKYGTCVEKGKWQTVRKRLKKMVKTFFK